VENSGEVLGEVGEAVEASGLGDKPPAYGEKLRGMSSRM
jgi:hypothetical protein